ncbi:MAG: hypothetical protein Aurels2KO_21780 [Aureliella sp.]
MIGTQWFRTSRFLIAQGLTTIIDDTAAIAKSLRRGGVNPLATFVTEVTTAQVNPATGLHNAISPPQSPHPTAPKNVFGRDQSLNAPTQIKL